MTDPLWTGPTAALWQELVHEADSSRSDPPIAIHSKTGDREEWGSADEEGAHSGLPFSFRFESYLDGRTPSALRTAALELRGRASTPLERKAAEFLLLVLRGERRPEQLRRRLRASRQGLRIIGFRALSALSSYRGGPDTSRLLSDNELLAERQRPLHAVSVAS